MTPTQTVADQVLALASAKKPCSVCYKSRGKILNVYFTAIDCDTCKGTGEVYVLGNEVREECIESCHCESCNETCPCGARGWLPLSPLDLNGWIMALAEARYTPRISRQRIDYHVLIQRVHGPGFWEAAADTPAEAFFQAATKALLAQEE